MAPADGMAWSMHCRRCDSALASHTHVSFIQENERAVHAVIERHDLHEREDTRAHGALTTEWTVSNAAPDEDPQTADVRFTKVTQRHVKKKKYTPYVLLCVACQNKFGAEANMEEWECVEFLLDSKQCHIKMVREGELVIAGAHESRHIVKGSKWSGVLRTLLELNWCVNVRRPSGTAVDGQLTERVMASDNAEQDMQHIVMPTVESIRETLQPSGRSSRLRHYQLELVVSALLENTIVYLPTGCGKTLVAVKVIDEMKRLNPNHKTAFLVPTGPLVSQQATYLRRESDLHVRELSGQHHSAKAKHIRKSMVHEADALCVTPQFFLNMLSEGDIQLANFCVLVFDEAHHATGADPYCDILAKVASLPYSHRPRVVALTASPFGEKATTTKGSAALQNLTQLFNGVFNTPTITADTVPLQDVLENAEWVIVHESEAEQALRNGIRKHVLAFVDAINRMPDGRITQLDNRLFDSSDNSSLFNACGKIRKLQRETHAMAKNLKQGNEGDGIIADLVYILKHVRRMLIAFSQLSIEGPLSLAHTLDAHFANIKNETKKEYKLISSSFEEHLAPTLAILSQNLDEREIVSSRVHQVAEIVRRAKFDGNSRAIVFVRRRKTAILLARIMEKLPILKALKPTKFIGHNSYEGMSWESEQRPILERFRSGRIRLLVATNVLEEGLDVPECSLVIQFDGIVGLTSLIQSRGRVRHKNGKFAILCTENGRDRLQEMIQNEIIMSETAQRDASMLPSKKQVEVIVDELLRAKSSEIGANMPASSQPVHPTPVLSEIGFSRLRPTQGIFCVFLGAVFDQNKEVQIAVLDTISTHAEICIVDNRLGLVALKARDPGAHTEDPEDARRISSACYTMMCQQLAFRTASNHHFWMKLDSSEHKQEKNNESSVDTCMILCTRMRRGMIQTGGSFVEGAECRFDGDDGQCAFRFASSYFTLESSTGIIIEFDIRAISGRVVWIEQTPEATSWIMYAMFQNAPKMWDNNGKRILEDFHHQALGFAFDMCVNSSFDASSNIQKLRDDMTKEALLVRDSRFHIIDAVSAPPCRDERIEPVSSSSRSSLPIAYALEQLVSVCSHEMGSELPMAFYEIVRGLDEDMRARAILEFQPSTANDDDIVHQFREFIQMRWPVLRSKVKRQESVVYKIVITPSRFLFERPQTAPENRVFRHFGSENFMYAYFRDENRERLDFADESIGNRVRRVLFDGIRVVYSCNGVPATAHFQFLGCSLSQVRNGSCIFTTLDPQEVRDWIGKLGDIKSPSKYLKRLGQAFSSTREAFEVSHDVMEDIADDIEHHTYAFNDGCGEITREGAKRVAEKLALESTPSAFQIRLGGAKGVLVVSDFAGSSHSTCTKSCQTPGTLELGHGLKSSVRLRRSMVKFQSTHKMLEVVAYSGPSLAYLTRQSITILSARGIPDATFLTLQDDYLEELRAMVASREKAMNELRSALPKDQRWWINILYDTPEARETAMDPLHRSIIRAIYRYKLVNTVLRARIPVAQGRSLMGVADFTGTLNEGEVFIQYTEVSDSADEMDREVVLTSRDVLVHRNPCHHPGDLRVLRCRDDVPLSLRHLRDCIVFPCKGTRPHPDECTGGDLDGDVFVAIWDKRLIPSGHHAVDAMEFSHDLTVPDADEHVDMHSLVKFYLHALSYDILGIASNAHLAVSDASKLGCLDRDALVLADICAREVDYCKNLAHLEVVRELAPAHYPDFMDNREKPLYTSDKVLGHMYRRCLAIYEHTVLPGEEELSTSGMDSDFLARGFEEYEDEAELVYEQYKYAVVALLRMSGAENEAELATGMLIDPDSLYKANYFRFGEQCKDAYERLRCAFQGEFDRLYGELPHDVLCKIAAAWYFVAYKDTDTTRQLSFPWLVAKFLVANKKAAAASSSALEDVIQNANTAWEPAEISITDLTIARLQNSILDQIDKRREVLLQDVFERLHVVASLKSALFPHFGNSVDCVLFGSSALLTFEPQSDLDVMISGSGIYCDDMPGNGNDAANEQFRELANFIELTYGHVDLKDQIRVPIARFSIDQWAVELCRSRSGPIKTQYFRGYMERYPFFWPSVYFLLQWGKCAGIIRRRCGGGHDMLAPVGFMWLFLRYCTEKGFVTRIDPLTTARAKSSPSPSYSSSMASFIDIEEEVSFWSALLERAFTGIDECIPAAKVVVGFLSYFADGATPDSAFAFQDPLDPSNDTRLTREHVEIFREKCYIAVHQLVIAHGDATSLLKYHKEQRSRITLSRALSKRVHESTEFFASKILREAGAASGTHLRFQRHPNALRADLYVADITGDGESVARIEQKVQRIEHELGMPMMHRSAEDFHREGCTLLLFEGAESQEDQIAFQEYMDERHIQHEHTRLHQAHLVCFSNGKSWLEHASASFCAKFIRQMVKLSVFERFNPDVPKAKAIARFGHHYLIHLPWSFDEESISRANIKKLEAEFERGRVARELYESVLVTKSRDRTEKHRDKEDERDCDSEDRKRGGGGGASSVGKPGHENKKREGLQLTKASEAEKHDRGTAHSFYSVIPAKLTGWLVDFATQHKGMSAVAKSESYQVSIIWDSMEFNVRLTPQLELVKTKTRPCRWFSATLKMHQELTDDGSRMDATPDVRYYVSSSEDVPPTHELSQCLNRACRNADGGRGVLQFLGSNGEESASLPTSPWRRVRVSEELLDEGITLPSITNVRHMQSTTYQCPITGLSLRVLAVREFTLPSTHTHEGFLRIKDKTEAELVMPPLTADARVDAGFAKTFLRVGIELVDYLRDQDRRIEDDIGDGDEYGHDEKGDLTEM